MTKRYEKVTRNSVTRLVVCILEAVLTVSPKKQYLGTLIPTTPATAGPEWIPATSQKELCYLSIGFTPCTDNHDSSEKK